MARAPAGSFCYCTAEIVRQQGWGTAVPPFIDPRSRSLPPLECCPGTRPSHTDIWRAVWNAIPLPIATMAVAAAGPTPSTFSIRWLRSSYLNSYLQTVVISLHARIQLPARAQRDRIKIAVGPVSASSKIPIALHLTQGFWNDYPPCKLQSPLTVTLLRRTPSR
jgi:hypothetical protein